MKAKPSETQPVPLGLAARFAFFRAHGGGWVGHSAVCAMASARAELRAEAEGLECRWEDEYEPWDGEAPAPAILVCGLVYDASGAFAGASLGMVGVNDSRDPYLRVVAAELFAEVFAEQDAKAAREAFRVSVCNAYIDSVSV